LDAHAPRSALRALTAEEWPAYFSGIQPLWGGGLEIDLFNLYQRRLANASESAQRYEILGLFDGERMLSAMKIYRFGGAHEGEQHVFRGVGAVFTPDALRRRGYAGQMLKLALARFRAEGAHAAVLFSDIGTRYYEKLGFRVLESAECKLDASMLPRGKGARPSGPGDEPQMIRALSRHREKSAGLSLEREDGWALRFQLRRLRELARTRNVGEPDWGVAVDSPTVRGEMSGAAMLRYTKDGLDILDASWDTGAARDAILGAVRDRLIRATKSIVRVWPAHQFRGLFPSGPRTNAVAMLCPLHPRAENIVAGTRAELSLLDHI
jgi:GNAT superfamily N-acetyltransferase